ncbi:hypothetical protein, partial [Mycobacterium sp.]|uniref:hypothetical protein n=1 Tax=Mycobacterium sp. TaxID=1785 RepID=UPI0031D77143
MVAEKDAHTSPLEGASQASDVVEINVDSVPVAVATVESTEVEKLFRRYCQDLWMRVFQATSVSVDSAPGSA